MRGDTLIFISKKYMRVRVGACACECCTNMLGKRPKILVGVQQHRRCAIPSVQTIKLACAYVRDCMRVS